jgi:Na+-driven multidrug efflux pump
MGGFISVAIAASELLYPEALPRFFTEDQGIVDKVENVLWVIAVMQPINGLVNVGAGVLQGAQDFTYQVRGASMVRCRCRRRRRRRRRHR